MKKQLMAGTALVAAVMLVAGGASAQDKKMADKKKMMKPSISVNGYGDFNVGGVVSSDVDANAAALDVYVDSEVHFNGRAELDSGVKIHIRTELETQSQTGTVGDNNKVRPDNLDEYFLSISGSFGQIIMGGTENAASKMVTKYAGSWATGVGENLSFDGARYVKNLGPWSQTRLSPGSGDEEKVTYISPSFNGFQVGASYIPYQGSEDTDPAGNTSMTGNSNGVAAAATYGGKFDQMSLGIGVGVLSVPGNTPDDADNDQWIAAVKVGFGPVTAALAFKREDASGIELMDGGLRYVQGPNSFSLTGMQVTPDDGDASYTAMMASYARALGPGVKTHVDLHLNDSEDADGNTNSGAGVGVGLTVSF